MASNDIVIWQKTYSVGIPLIDTQHMELINLTNRLYRSCLRSREQSMDVFMDVLRGAVSYVGYHFSVEEKIMNRVNYPEFTAHKTKHNEFVKEVLKTVDEISKNVALNPLNFVMFLKDWVLAHIAVMDTALGKYLINLKHYGSLNSITLRVKTVEGRYVIE